MITLDNIRSLNETYSFDDFELCDMIALMQETAIDESVNVDSLKAKIRRVFDMIIQAITRVIGYITGKIRHVINKIKSFGGTVTYYNVGVNSKMKYVIDNILDVAYTVSIKNAGTSNDISVSADRFIKDNRDIEYVFELAHRFDGRNYDKSEASDIRKQIYAVRDKYDAIYEALYESGNDIYDRVGATYGAKLGDSNHFLDTALKMGNPYKAIYFLTIEKRVVTTDEYNRTVDSFNKDITNTRSMLTNKLDDTKKIVRAEQRNVIKLEHGLDELSTLNPYWNDVFHIIEIKVESLSKLVSNVLEIGIGLHRELISAVSIMETLSERVPHANRGTKTKTDL